MTSPLRPGDNPAAAVVAAVAMKLETGLLADQPQPDLHSRNSSGRLAARAPCSSLQKFGCVVLFVVVWCSLDWAVSGSFLARQH